MLRGLEQLLTDFIEGPERMKTINPGVKVAYHTDGCVY